MLVGAIAVAALVVFCAAMAPGLRRVENLYTEVQGVRTLLPGRCARHRPERAVRSFHAARRRAGCAGRSGARRSGTLDASRADHGDPDRIRLGLVVLIVATDVRARRYWPSRTIPCSPRSRPSPRPDAGGLGARNRNRRAGRDPRRVFFVAYGSSRQLHHLASSRALPGWLARTNRHGAPVTALAWSSTIGAVTAMFPPDAAMVVFIFLMMLMYELLLIAFLRFQHSRPSRRGPIARLEAAWSAGSERSSGSPRHFAVTSSRSKP